MDKDILREAEKDVRLITGFKVQARQMRRGKKARKKRRSENPERFLALHYDTLTVSQRVRVRTILTIRQDGRCAICECKQSENRQFAIDHDHTTGHIRGLLCGRCNTMLGFARDNIHSLAAAIQYLETDRARDFQ